MLIAIASDHKGYNLKNILIEFLKEAGHKVVDLGTNNEDSVDYPDFAKKLCEFYLEDDVNFGILICGTGIGMSIAANRLSEIRAALCITEDMSEKARLHNDANILVLGSDYTNNELAKKITQKFIDTPFEGGRHLRRLKKIE